MHPRRTGEKNVVCQKIIYNQVNICKITDQVGGIHYACISVHNLPNRAGTNPMVGSETGCRVGSDVIFYSRGVVRRNQRQARD